MTFIAAVVIAVYLIIISKRLTVIESSLSDLKKRRGVVQSATPVKQAQAPIFEPAPEMPAAPAPFVASAKPIEPIEPVAQVNHVPSPVETPSSEETLGKTLGVIGIFAVLFGIAFFLKYAFDNELIGISGRLVLGFVVGMLGLALGRMLKSKYESYSQILSGGGIGILFVTAYSAHVLYQVISAPLAYTLFGLITAVSVWLSIMDGKMTLAAIGVAAGFLAPILVAARQESFGPLFVYALIINAGVAAIAYAYRWLPLHYIAFVGTFITTASWIGRLEDDSQRILFAAFVTLYFLIFLAASVFHHIVRQENSKGSDVFFITLNAFWFVSFVYPVLKIVTPDGMGVFMAIVGLLYLALAYISFTSHKQDKLLNTALPLTGLFFFTIAIPLHFHGSWITAAWFIEAFILCAVDYKINGRRLYAYSMIIYFIGVLRLFTLDARYDGSLVTFIPIFNERFFVFVIAVLTGLGMAYFIRRAIKDAPESEKVEVEQLKPLPTLLGVFTQFVALFLITSEIHYYFASEGSDARGLENTVISIAWAIYAVFLTVLGFVLHSKAFRGLGMLLFILTAGRIFISLWELGPLYRIVTSITFGVIALGASFLYARYKEKIKTW